ncbi:hypothetical protein [Moraxella cuniculi]|uniref:ScoMcrA-like SRA domain-containing protein n=1 Tax=Moraxella cuniculi TaxID=34061 RepID=A0A3S4QR57_9GAMM|nr:hypothetical protein [Moraxella cuniculi]VEG12336.1 Uncharacterised protein [Moraxella cuniculi]
MGLKGDQDINFSQNKTLAESGFNGVQVLLFNSSKPNCYQYASEVYLVGEPFYQTQQDEDNKNRKVIVFPLKNI